MLKAVIFDMDGVIIDSEPLHARANILALKEFGIDLSLDYIYQFIGNTILYMCETIQKDFNLCVSAEELSQASARQIEYLHSIEGYTSIPYIKELIINLYENGIKLAIASSSTVELIEKIVNIFELRPYFTKLISGTTVAHSKPAPDIFLKACEELRVLPDEALVIEDSKNGVLASTRANIPVIGFSNPSSGNQDLSLASMIVEGFEEVDYSFLNRVYCHAHNLPAPIASTKRLLIRELGMKDVPDLYNLYQEDHFLAQNIFFANSFEEAKQKQQAYINHMYHFLGYGLWGVYQKDTNKFIGHCGLETKDILCEEKEYSICQLSYGIAKDFCQNGYAYEACIEILNYAKHTLDLDEVYLLVKDSNAPSIALANKLGFIPRNTASYVYDEQHISYLLYRKIL